MKVLGMWLKLAGEGAVLEGGKKTIEPINARRILYVSKLRDSSCILALKCFGWDQYLHWIDSPSGNQWLRGAPSELI